MRLEQLVYCIEVAHSKSMSQASKKLFITQSTLSTAIQNLEEELGFQIFKRSSQGVLITDKGKALLEKAVIVISQVEEIRKLSTNNNAIRQNVTIAAVPAACNALTTELICEIKKEDKNINMSIIELRPDKIIHSLVQSQSDIIIGSYSEGNKGNVYNEAAKYNIVIEPIFKDRMYAFLGRNHPKARQQSVTMEELQGYTQAFFNDRVLMEIDEDDFQGVDPDQSFYSFTDKSSIKKVVASGVAYATLPYSMAYEDIYIDSGLIKALPITDCNAILTMYVGYKSSVIQTREERMVMEKIRELYENVEQKLCVRLGNGYRSNVNNKLLVY